MRIDESSRIIREGTMEPILRNLFRALGRVFPDCIMLSQAIAFNMFLAFFPVLLLSLGLLGATSLFHDALSEIPARLSLILPPGSTDVVFAYFVRKGAANPWGWISLGLGGTLLAGTQVMAGYMEGFRLIEGDPLRQVYWRRQLRAVGLLCVTIVPMMTVVVLTVFGRQARPWLVRHTGFPLLIRDFAFLFYALLVFVLAMAVLVMLYGIGVRTRPLSEVCCREQWFRRCCGGRWTELSVGTSVRCLTTLFIVDWQARSVSCFGCSSLR